MSNRKEVNGSATNDELARRLFQRDSRKVPPANPPTLEALASVRDRGGPPQAWTLGGIPDAILRPVSERERRALFAALNKGTKASLRREPTVSELVLLVEAVDHARALVSSTHDAIEGRTNVYLENGKFTFRGPT